MSSSSSSPIDHPVDPSKPTAASEWHGHEHVAETAKLQAQKLVDELGSVALAKHAVEAVGEAMNTITTERREEALAKALGFASVSSLMDASEPVTSNDGHHWQLTRISDTAWAVWNDFAFQAERQFSDRDEALATVPHDDTLSGTSLLG